jgi:hypothetical protein
MTEPLSLDRFRALADAYGGAVARWPESYRDAASRLAATRRGAAILERASALDAHLDAWRIPAPAADLSARIVTGGRSAARKRTARWRLWWSGIGVSAALAGAVAGSAAVAMVAPADGAGSSTAFGDIVGSGG